MSAGTDLVTFHIEATDEPQGLIEEIHAAGAAAGVALNPSTPLEAVEPLLAAAEVVLVMSVEPGFGGQKFEQVALDKLRLLSGEIGSHVVLEVDGGVNTTTIADCAAAGARLFVAGSAIFKTPDYAQSIASLTRLAENSARMHQ